MNAQKLISEISQAQKSSSLLTMNRTVQIEGIRRKEITERQIFTHIHPDITNKGKNIKKNQLQTIVSNISAAVTDFSRIFSN